MELPLSRGRGRAHSFFCGRKGPCVCEILHKAITSTSSRLPWPWAMKAVIQWEHPTVPPVASCYGASCFFFASSALELGWVRLKIQETKTVGRILTGSFTLSSGNLASCRWFSGTEGSEEVMLQAVFLQHLASYWCVLRRVSFCWRALMLAVTHVHVPTSNAGCSSSSSPSVPDSSKPCAHALTGGLLCFDLPRK